MSAGIQPEEFVANAARSLAEMQQNLFDRAKKLRDDASTMIDSLAEFENYFAEDAPGGLAYCQFVDSEAMEAKLKELKVTVRCVPLDAPEEQGKCIFTGAESTKRAVFARAY